MKNKKFEIQLLRIAEDDFLEIISFIKIDNPKAAQSIANKIEKSLTSLSENPFLGRTPDDIDLSELGYRYLIIDNYLIFYTIGEGKIFIHRILHGARNYKILLV